MVIAFICTTTSSALEHYVTTQPNVNLEAVQRVLGKNYFHGRVARIKPFIN